MAHPESNLRDEPSCFYGSISSAHPPTSPRSGRDTLSCIAHLPKRGDRCPVKKVTWARRLAHVTLFTGIISPPGNRNNGSVVSYLPGGVGGGHKTAPGWQKTMTHPGKIKSGVCHGYNSDNYVTPDLFEDHHIVQNPTALGLFKDCSPSNQKRVCGL